MYPLLNMLLLLRLWLARPLKASTGIRYRLIICLLLITPYVSEEFKINPGGCNVNWLSHGLPIPLFDPNLFCSFKQIS